MHWTRFHTVLESRSVTKTISIFIAIVLSYGLFTELRITAFPRLEDGNTYPTVMFMAGSPALAGEIPQNWKCRQLSFNTSWAWASLWMDGPPTQTARTENGQTRKMEWVPGKQAKYSNIVASYYALCFLFLCVALIIFLENPIIPMIGTFASILTSAPSFFAPFILPWDMPTMAAWTVIALIYLKVQSKQKWTAMAFAIIFLGLFKETVLVTALLFLGTPWSWSKRICSIIGIVVFSQLLNWGFFGARPDWMFSAGQGAQSGGDRWNPLMLWPLLLANAGSLALMPWLLLKKRDWPLAVACGTFIVLQALNNLACGVYNENRDWLELAPIGWILISQYLDLKSPTLNLQPATKQ